MTIVLETERLSLQPYEDGYAEQVVELAGDHEVAATTFVPHPYTLQDAKDWIGLHKGWIDEGTAYPLAMILKSTGELVGTMTLRVDKKHNKGELAYWVGKPYWGKGYASEAAKRITSFGFDELNLHRVWGAAMTANSASSKVMQNAGLSYEGTMRDDLYHWGEYSDIDFYGKVEESVPRET